MLERSLQKPKEKKEVEKIMNVTLPRGITEIIQTYIWDNKSSPNNQSTTDLSALSYNQELISLSVLSFFNTDNKTYLAEKAAYYILWGQPKKCQMIIQEHPDVLFLPVKKVKGPHGNQAMTPFQALLWTDDKYIKDIEEGKTFLKMALSYLSDEQLRQAKEQYEKWFKDWDEEAHVKELQNTFDKVVKLFDKSKAMTDTELKSDTTLQQAIQNFKHYLKNAVLDAKKNCIPQLWDYASQVYTVKKYKAYGGYDSQKNKLFSSQLLGTIDINSPAWMMQILHKGVYYTAVISAIRCGIFLNPPSNLYQDALDYDDIIRDDVSSYYLITPLKGNLGIDSCMTIYGRLEKASYMREGKYVFDHKSPVVPNFFFHICFRANRGRPKPYSRPKQNKCLIL